MRVAVTNVRDVVDQVEVPSPIRCVEVLHLAPHYVQRLAMCKGQCLANVPVSGFQECV